MNRHERLGISPDFAQELEELRAAVARRDAGHDAPFGEFLAHCSSYERPWRLAMAMRVERSARGRYRLFLEWWNACDAPWHCRSDLAEFLRSDRAAVDLLELLGPEERGCLNSLPPLVNVFRGCQRGRERGLSWTLKRSTAETFARGMRCINSMPTFVSAVIPKQHIFAVMNEAEIVLDPRRLRQMRAEPRQMADPAEYPFVNYG